MNWFGIGSALGYAAGGAEVMRLSRRELTDRVRESERRAAQTEHHQTMRIAALERTVAALEQQVSALRGPRPLRDAFRTP